MKLKKIMSLIVIVICVITLIVYLIVVNSDNEVPEYTPQAEITDDELRNTIVTLYFENKDTGELQTEARLVDSKELLNDPYQYLVNLLIEGPKNDSLRKIIPEGAVLKNTTLLGECLTLNFSKEFLSNATGDAFSKSNIIYSIINTVTELKEVSRVKFLIDDVESDGFNDVGISFKNEFTRLNNTTEQ